MEIKINPEFQNLIGPLTKQESDDLETMITAQGCTHPILVWKKTGEIVDGHNRYRICTKLGKEYQVERVSFSCVEEVKTFIIMNQLARRNVTPKQAAVYRGMLYNARKKETTNPDGNNQHGEVGDQSEHQPKTADLMAAEFNVAAATIRRDAALAEALEATGQLTAYIAGEIDASRNQIISDFKKTKPKPQSTKTETAAWVKVWRAFKKLTHKEQIEWVAYYEDHWTKEDGVVEL